MANKYNINIQNNSGIDQNYVIFEKHPIVTPIPQSQIWTSVLDSSVTPDTETASFEIYKKYYGVCGNSHGTLEDGVKVTVRGTEPVTLGVLSDDGTRIPGTTLRLQTSNSAQPFDLNVPAASSLPNAFEIDTQPDFALLEAKQNNFVIGLGASTSGNDKIPSALFIPQPNCKYQIQPSNTYVVAFGDYSPGTLIDGSKVGETLEIDFARHSPTANVVHNNRGSLVLQVDPQE